MSASCSRMIGGGRGGVFSVCTLPGGVSERRVCCESEDSPPRTPLSGVVFGVRTAGSSLGSVNSSGGNSPVSCDITAACGVGPPGGLGEGGCALAAARRGAAAAAERRGGRRGRAPRCLLPVGGR
jgi:hypothetical protein